MKNKEYSKIVMIRDDNKVNIDINVWDYTVTFISPNEMRKNTSDIRKLDDTIDFYLKSGYAVVQMIPKH